LRRGARPGRPCMLWCPARYGRGPTSGPDRPIWGCPGPGEECASYSGAMSRRQRRSARPFENLGPLETPIPISTGYARLRRENDGSVLLDINGMPSSHLHPDPEFLVFEYMRWMQLVIELQLAAGDVRSSAPQLAHLGGGGCSLPRALAAAHPDSRQIVVELDALLAEQVRPWFDLPRSPQLRLRVDDALGALS